jgi:hypothetical protein
LRLGELWRAAHVLPAPLRPAAALCGAGADKVARIRRQALLLASARG